MRFRFVHNRWANRVAGAEIHWFGRLLFLAIAFAVGNTPMAFDQCGRNGFGAEICGQRWLNDVYSPISLNLGNFSTANNTLFDCSAWGNHQIHRFALCDSKTKKKKKNEKLNGNFLHNNSEKDFLFIIILIGMFSSIHNPTQIFGIFIRHSDYLWMKFNNWVLLNCRIQFRHTNKKKQQNNSLECSRLNEKPSDVSIWKPIKTKTIMQNLHRNIFPLRSWLRRFQFIIYLVLCLKM